MPSKMIDRLRDELGEWRTRLDELRVKGNLTGKELRDQLDEARRAYWRAKGRFDALRELHAEKWKAAGEAVEKGWDELRETYRKERERLRDERGSVSHER